MQTKQFCLNMLLEVWVLDYNLTWSTISPANRKKYFENNWCRFFNLTFFHDKLELLKEHWAPEPYGVHQELKKKGKTQSHLRINRKWILQLINNLKWKQVFSNLLAGCIQFWNNRQTAKCTHKSKYMGH